MTRNVARHAVDFAGHLDLCEDLFSVTDLRGRFIACNAAWERFLGRDREGILSESMLIFLTPVDRAFMTASLEEASRTMRHAGQVPFRRALHFTGPDGSTKKVEFRGTFDFNAELFTCVGREVAVVESLDPAPPGEIEISRSEARFRAAMNAHPATVYYLEAERNRSGSIVDFIFIEANENAEKHFAVSGDRLIGSRMGKLFPWLKGDGLFERYVHSVESGTAFEEEVDLSVPGTAPRWILHQAIPMDQGLCVMTHDISDKKRLEKDLRDQKKFLSDVFDHIPLAVYCKDATDDFRYILWNKHSEELFGIPRHEALGKNDYDYFPRAQADFFRADDVKTLKSGAEIEIPVEEVDTKNSGRRKLRTKKTPMSDQSGKPRYLLGLSEDITELKAPMANKKKAA